MDPENEYRIFGESIDRLYSSVSVSPRVKIVLCIFLVNFER